MLLCFNFSIFLVYVCLSFRRDRFGWDVRLILGGQHGFDEWVGDGLVGKLGSTNLSPLSRCAGRKGVTFHREPGSLRSMSHASVTEREPTYWREKSFCVWWCVDLRTLNSLRTW